MGLHTAAQAANESFRMEIPGSTLFLSSSLLHLRRKNTKLCIAGL